MGSTTFKYNACSHWFANVNLNKCALLLFLSAAREYAKKAIKTQMTAFKRWGVMPTGKTMNFSNDFLWPLLANIWSRKFLWSIDQNILPGCKHPIRYLRHLKEILKMYWCGTENIYFLLGFESPYPSSGKMLLPSSFFISPTYPVGKLPW